MKRNSRPNCTTDDGAGTLSLPDSIIMYEILPRLPVKTLIRFQLVSKNWLDYISKNPNFVKLHMKLSSSLRPQFLVDKFKTVEEMKNPFYLLPRQECTDVKDLEHVMVDAACQGDDSISTYVDSCNGLVCLYNNNEVLGTAKSCFFGVWNPATRKCRKIDSPCGVDISLAYGFGYVSSLDDYKIVASFATESVDIRLAPVCRGFYVFSLRSGKWERICGNYDYCSRDREWKRIKSSDSDEGLMKKMKLVGNLKDKGLCHEGIIYWPCRIFSSSKKTNIVLFDLTNNDGFREYECTDWLNRYKSMELFRFKGSLALHGTTFHNVCEFWMLLMDDNDDDDWGSWQILVSVNLTKVLFVTLSEDGKCLVRQSELLKLVDFSKEALESCEEDVFSYSYCWLDARDHVESLVSPFQIDDQV